MVLRNENYTKKLIIRHRCHFNGKYHNRNGGRHHILQNSRTSTVLNLGVLPVYNILLKKRFDSELIFVETLDGLIHKALLDGLISIGYL